MKKSLLQNSKIKYSKYSIPWNQFNPKNEQVTKRQKDTSFAYFNFDLKTLYDIFVG